MAEVSAEVSESFADIASDRQAMRARAESLDFDAASVRKRYAGAFRPKPWIFWSDMILSAGIGWGAFVVALQHPLFSPEHLAYTAIAILGLLRGALFIHELAHLKRGALPGFEIGWHALVGVPLQLPSLMYVGSHGDHHKKTAFGTMADPEYAPIARWSRTRIARFVLGVALVPLAIPLRWGVMAPLSYLIPPFRRLVVERGSTLVINPEYRRPMPKGRHARRWAFQEAAAGVFFWAVAAGLWMGWLPLVVLFEWYVVAAGILVVNQLRTLAAHGYENEGEQVDATGQLLDSINLRGIPVLTALVAPVGLRYHALHHFLPSVPYHALGTLHRRLRAELPLEAPYHRTERQGILPTLRDLWRHAPQST